MTSFLAGYGEKKITPPPGTDLAGFGFYLDRRAATVRDDLKVRALCIESDENILFLISHDLLGLTVEFCDRIRSRLSKDHRVSVKNILVACTHTHSGPAVQPLPGLGKVNSAYVRTLPGAILEAAAKARASLEKSGFGFHEEAVEPIGYNRRLNDFSEVDCFLRAGIFKQKKRTIFLLNYACHPVTLGPTKEISSDWPGAAVRAIEATGNRAMILQGFCGDIDPVTYMNRRLGNTKRDYELCGQIIASRALKAMKYAIQAPQAGLAATEDRIRLPLSVFPKEDLDKETEAALEANKQFPHASRIVRLWRTKVEKVQESFLRSPWMENVPVQAMSIGGMKILGCPGEVFSGIGLKLRSRWPSLMTVGYANGDVGYLPTEEAFKAPGDYACYCAPKFYGAFGFTPRLESVLLDAGDKLLSRL